jgi:hypothetical protein
LSKTVNVRKKIKKDTLFHFGRRLGSMSHSKGRRDLDGPPCVVKTVGFRLNKFKTS